MSKKVTKTQLAAIRIIKDCGGAVLTSHWTNGNGRYITKRAVPPHCERVTRYTPNMPKRVTDVFKRHPRCEAVIAITNMRAVNKLFKSTTPEGS
tara:strand:- start:166 stop:447 length:282 start_codon:yes stop_codon:yes gene_type:complete